MDLSNISRRGFLKTSAIASGGLVVAFVVPGAGTVTISYQPADGSMGRPFSMNVAQFTGGGVAMDMKRVKERKDEISGKSRTGVEHWLKIMANCTVYEGHACFESPSIVAIGEEKISAPQIFINVGGRAVRPRMPGLDQVPYLTNSSMMEVDFLPRHLVIVGGSYIGLEFAQMFRRFGSEVTIIEKNSRLIQREDAEVSQCIKEFLEANGVSRRTGGMTAH